MVDKGQRMDNLYNIEIEAALDHRREKNSRQGKPCQNRVTFAQDESRPEADIDEIQFAGKSNLSLTEMRFIRMKIKSMVAEDADLLKELHAQVGPLSKGKLSLTVNLPLPDIYNRCIRNQSVTLSNYNVISENEFEFTSLTMYNFMISEDTFNQLSTSEMTVAIDNMPIEGKVKMSKLLMSPGYKLSVRVPLTKVIIIPSKISQMSAQERKAELMKAKKGRQNLVQKKADEAKRARDAQDQRIESHAGFIDIELNLQRGDTEEEIERNYQIKMKHQEEKRKMEEEMERMEKRRRASMLLEAQPTFAQLYLRVGSLSRGGLLIDRDGNDVEGVSDLQRAGVSDLQRADSHNEGGEGEDEGEGEEKDEPELIFPQRNLYVSYKAFPTLEKLITSIMYRQSEPNFNYRSQFPVLINPDSIEKLEKFTFVLEVWDEVSSTRSELVGLVKYPLASFCYSMQTSDDDIFSLNFLAEQHNTYPMIITDEFLPIYSPRHGQNVGQLKVTLALGTPSQVNRQIAKEGEVDRSRIEKTLAMEKTKMHEQLLKTVHQNAGAQNQKDQEEKMKTLIQDNNQQRDQEEEARIAESHSKSPLQSLFNLPGRASQSFEGNPAVNKFATALRQSLQLSGSRRDYDLRDTNFLQACRKMFEEMSLSEELNDFTSDMLFNDEVKGFDGSVHKDEFIYIFLNQEEFTLTRTEISNICALLLNISAKDNKDRVDLEQIQYSYTSYLKYRELIESRVIDLLEKFKLAVSKRLESQAEIENLLSSIELHCENSQIRVQDLKVELEDRRGIVVRDTMYDQLASYFDLDRSGQIYITSFCNYIRDPTVAAFNFFKLNPSALTNHVVEYLRNCLTGKPELLRTLESELKKEIFWRAREQQKLEAGMDDSQPKEPLNDDLVEIDSDGALNMDEEPKKKKKKKDPDQPPLDLLLRESINAKLLQFKLKRLGIVVSLWEIFTLFEFINMRLAKMPYEPQRYHHIMFEHLYKAMTSSDYKVDILQIGEVVPPAKNQKKTQKTKEAARQIEAPPQIEDREEECDEVPIKDQQSKSVISESAAESKDESSEEEESSSDAVSDDSLCESERSRRREKRRAAKLAKLTYLQVKHIFSIDVKQLKNIPVLTKFIKEARQLEQVTGGGTQKNFGIEDEEGSYIQDVAVKYSFPLDEDEILESDYIKKASDESMVASQNANYDYNVSMNTIHTYRMPKEDKIEDLLNTNKQLATSNAQSTNLFNMSVVFYQEGREFVIGNAQLPIEDITDLIKDHDQKARSYNRKEQKSVLSRVLFLYGTSYSQRANCIIGKLAVEITYQSLPQYLTKMEAKAFKKEQKSIKKGVRHPTTQTNCFMQRETYINRKIPLNALFTVQIEKVTHLKESIENIEHFAKFNASVFDSYDEMPRSFDQPVDRRKILTQILKQGMNLVVISSIFDEDEDLQTRFPESKQQTRMLYNTLNPIFQEHFQVQAQMDTRIFDYLKTKRAVFEVRHYLDQGKTSFNARKSSESLSDYMEGNSFFTLGYVRVPLLHLITKNKGIDGDFVILDDYKQRMGVLSLRICLNHHNSQRPLFAGSTQMPNQLSMSKPATGGVGTDFQRPSAQQQQTSKVTTLIDRSVTLRNSMDINRQAQATSSGPDFNSRASSTSLGASLKKKPREIGNNKILALNFVELLLADRQNLLDYSYEMGKKGKASLLFLKFKFLGQTYHTKLISLNETNFEDRGGVHQIQSPQMKALNLACFDIKKTILLTLDLLDQATIESAFSCPLEIQLWNRVTSSIPYRQPDSEDLLGSFFVELNELSKVQNLRVKGIRQEKFTCSEMYYTLYDLKSDQVSRDRLALKLYLLDNDHAEAMKEFDTMWHDNGREEVEEQIINKLDPLAKGYVELEDLQTLVEEKVADRKVANKLLTLINENLEFKNTDSVYYSPLFGLPPPYFKQASSFRTFEFTQQTMQELTSLDSRGTGFLPMALFRQALEQQLKIKPKIVEDFIETGRQPLKSLDVNCTVSTFQSQLDFIVLVRKLAKLVEIHTPGTQTIASLMTLPPKSCVEPEQKLILSIDVLSAMRLINPVNEMEPPNSFVRFRLPQAMYGVVSEDDEFKTNVINESCYPSWQSRNHKVIVPLSSANMDHIVNGTQLLEFDVLHSQFEGYQQTQPTITLIGTAYVDFSALALDTSQKENIISGYFHIINQGQVRSSKDLSYMEVNNQSRQSKGQLRVTVRAESDKNGEVLRSTQMLGQRSTISRRDAPTTSQETFGNRLNQNQMGQSIDLSGPTLSGIAYNQDKRLEISPDDDFDVDREQPCEEEKFGAINQSHTLTTVNEKQQQDFNDTLAALNRDYQNVSSFQRVAELGATAKRDDQVATMTSYMRLKPDAVSQSVDQAATEDSRPIFNPFNTTVGDEDDDQRFKSPPSQQSRQSQHDDQQSLERE